jgi:hypothetical protein
MKAELEQESDIERALEASAASFALSGTKLFRGDFDVATATR